MQWVSKNKNKNNTTVCQVDWKRKGFFLRRATSGTWPQAWHLV